MDKDATATDIQETVNPATDMAVPVHDIFVPGHPAPEGGLDPFQEMYYNPLLYDRGIFVKIATPGGGKSYQAHQFMTQRIRHAILTGEEQAQEQALLEYAMQKKSKEQEEEMRTNLATKDAPLIVFVSPQVSHCTEAYQHIRENLEKEGFTEQDYAPYLIYIASIPDCIRKVLITEKDQYPIPSNILSIEMQQGIRNRYSLMTGKLSGSDTVRNEFYDYIQTCKKEIKKNILIKENLMQHPVSQALRDIAIRTVLKKPEYKWFHELFPAYRKDTARVIIMSSRMITRKHSTPFSGGAWLNFFNRTDCYFIIDESDTVKRDWRDYYIEEASKGQMSYNINEVARTLSYWDREDYRGPITENGRRGRELRELHKLARENIIHPMVEEWYIGLRMDIAQESMEAFEKKKLFLYRDWVTKISPGTGMRIKVNTLDDKGDPVEEDMPEIMSGNRYPTVEISDENEQEHRRVNQLYFKKIQKADKKADEEDEADQQDESAQDDKYLVDYIDDFYAMAHSLIKLYVDPALEYLAAIERRKGNQVDDTNTLALNSFLSRCGWRGNTNMRNFFINNINPYGSALTKPQKTFDMNTFYDRGFSNCEVAKVGYTGDVELKSATCSTTPELIVASLATKNRVVLVSATSDSGSLGNFDLETLKARFPQDFHMPSREELQRIAEFLRLDELDDRLKVVCADALALQDPPETRSRNNLSITTFKEKVFARAGLAGILPKERLAEHMFEGTLTEIFRHYNATAERKGKKINPFNYIVNRYLCFAYFYFEAQLLNLQSILGYEPLLLSQARSKEFITTEETKEMDGFVEDVLYDLLDEIDNTFGFVPFERYSLRAADFRDYSNESGFGKVREDYRQGKKVCVLTTPASAGIGVNPTLPLRENEDIFEIPAAGREAGTERNFAAIFLGKFTNLFTRPQRGAFMSDEEYHIQLFTALYETAEAHERCAITAWEKEKRALSCLTDSFFGQDPLLTSNLASEEVIYRMKQVTGRMFRRPVYDHAILYGCAGENIEYLKGTLDRTDPLLNPIMRDIARRAPSENFQMEIEKWAIALQKSAHVTAHRITLLLRGVFKGNITRIAEYDRLREDIMQNGVVIGGSTYDALPAGSLKTMYVEVPREIAENGYSYIALTRNYKEVLVGRTPKDARHMGEDVDGLKDYPCLEASVYASGILQFHGLAGFKDWAQAKGFWDGSVPTDEERYYILNPTAFNNLYKGRLGEAVFDYMCESHGLPYKELAIPAMHEHADRISDDGRIAIDVKNYSNGKGHDIYEELKKKIQHPKGDVLECDEYWFVGVRPGKQAYVATTGRGADQIVVTKKGRTIRVRMMQLFIEKHGVIKPNETVLKMLRMKGKDVAC